MPDKQNHLPNLQDIATAAGVSTATVSRVLNSPADVRPALREKVEVQIRKLGYVRHGAARALASARSHTVGAVIPTLESAIFASGVNAVENRLTEAGYTLLLAVTNYDLQHEYEQVKALIERGVDGMILVGRDHDPATLIMLERQGCPYVTTWTYTADAPHPCVGFDNADAAHRITAHLLALGHTRIGVIAGITSGNDRARERIAGVKAALKSQQLNLHRKCLIEKPYEVSEGRDAFRTLMALPNDIRPTALFCGNDVLAVGAVLEAQHMGLKVPQNISIVGFDDLPLSAHMSPGLTTVHVPSRRMGEHAADYILACIGGESPDPRNKLPTDIMIRGTTARPSKT
ncbi:MAG: substrate-binding domain-containing protein [Rhodospirillales bacterium]|nr:substrate-binding domain-containing protein [Rhodospirillales bacterium]MBO6785484.1 substrate-binding domain-containing protein [Rhodospirillales bacterium]